MTQLLTYARKQDCNLSAYNGPRRSRSLPEVAVWMVARSPLVEPISSLRRGRGSLTSSFLWRPPYYSSPLDQLPRPSLWVSTCLLGLATQLRQHSQFECSTPLSPLRHLPNPLGKASPSTSPLLVPPRVLPSRQPGAYSPLPRETGLRRPPSSSTSNQQKANEAFRPQGPLSPVPELPAARESPGSPRIFSSNTNRPL